MKIWIDNVSEGKKIYSQQNTDKTFEMKLTIKKGYQGIQNLIKIKTENNFP